MQLLTNKSAKILSDRNRAVKIIFTVFLIILLFPSAMKLITDPVSFKKEIYQKLHNRGYDVFINQNPKDAVLNAFKAFGRISNKNLRQIEINIKFKHYRNIVDVRQRAMSLGMLIRGGDEEMVPATLVSDGEKIKVKIRLKGDSPDHWSTDKWSYRVKVMNDSHFMGMRRFSIQHPVTRAFQAEHFIHETMRKYGVLAPRYEFVNLIFNGNDLGVMAVEESFGKELLEYNGRRVGVIFKFNEQNCVIEKMIDTELTSQNIYKSLRATHVEAFQAKKVRGDLQMSSEFDVAVGMMRGFVQNKLPASEVFNVEITGRFLAILEIWGAAHSVDWRNIRFYLNPITLKIEPIAYDSNIVVPAPLGSVAQSELGGMLLADSAIYEVYQVELKKITEDFLEGGWTDELRIKEEKILDSFGYEFFLLQRYPWSRLAARLSMILDKGNADNRANLEVTPANTYKTSGSEYIKFIEEYLEHQREPILVYHVKNRDREYIEFINPLPVAVELLSVKEVNSTNKSVVYVEGDQLPISLAPDLKALGSVGKRIYISSDIKLIGKNLQVKIKIIGGDKTFWIKAKPYSEMLERHPLQGDEIEKLLARHEFMELSDDGSEVRIRQGTWLINTPIRLPPNVDVIIYEGTQLMFSENAYILARGAVNINGSQKKPVILMPMGRSDGLQQQNWLGLAVLEAANKSKWTNVQIIGTKGVKDLGWALTGGVTFYKSEFEAHNVEFLNHSGEDALNIIHSRFALNNVKFINSASDSLDIDYSTGIIADCKITRSGGDGVDLSGSRVNIERMQIKDVRDKAISVGERSFVEAERVSIVRSSTGIAVKDGSELKLTSSSINSTSFAGIAAYRKKSEYGFARVKADGVTITGSGRRLLSQTGSMIIFDGVIQDQSEVDVDMLYETIMRK